MARWDDLFADLEAQADAAEAAELTAEVSALQVATWARTRWLDRLRPRLGEDVRVRLVDGSLASGTVDGIGPDWLLLAGADEVLVAATAVVEVAGLATRSESEHSAVLARLGLPHALRRLGERAEPVLVRRLGSPDVRGRVLRVGLDHVDLAVDVDDVDGGAARQVVTQTFAGLVSVRPL